MKTIFKTSFLANYILDEHGVPQLEPDRIKAAMWFTNTDRTLKQDQVGNHATVSTVFVGISHIMWETMVFGGELNMCQSRAATKEEALANHARMVELVEAAEKPRCP